MVTGGSNFPFGEMRYCWWSFWSVERVEVSPGSKGLLVAGWVLQERQTIGVVWSVDLVRWLVGFLLMVMVESLCLCFVAGCFLYRSVLAWRLFFWLCHPFWFSGFILSYSLSYSFPSPSFQFLQCRWMVSFQLVWYWSS